MCFLYSVNILLILPCQQYTSRDVVVNFAIEKKDYARVTGVFGYLSRKWKLLCYLSSLF